MTILTQNNFKGGMAEDIRETATDKFAYAKNFDISTSLLAPLRKTVDERYTVTGEGITERITDVVLHSDSCIYGLGRAQVESVWKSAIYKKDAYNDTFYSMFGSYDETAGQVPNSLTPFDNKLFYLLESSIDPVDDTYTYLRAYDPVSLTLAEIGTIEDTATIHAKPFVHTKKNILYIPCNNVLARYAYIDGSWSFNAAALTVPASMNITSLSEYGDYIAIGCAPKNNHGNSRVFLWDGDASLNDVTESIDWGEGSLMILENISGSLVGISQNYDYSLSSNLIIREYKGYSANIVKNIPTSGANLYDLKPFKEKYNDKIYFPLRLTIDGEVVYQIWVVGKDSNGVIYITPERLANGDTAISQVYGFSMVGDMAWISVDGYALKTTPYDSSQGTISYPASTLATLVNPLMAAEDRHKRKTLKAVAVTTVSGGEITFQYKADGGAWTNVFTQTLSAGSTLSSTTEAIGALFEEANEYQFRIISSAGTTAANVASYTYEYSIVNSQI